MDFDPKNFMQSVAINLNKLRDVIPTDGFAACNLVGNLFELGTEINNNLNRIAAAQERLATIAEADFAGAVEHEVQARVEFVDIDERTRQGAVCDTRRHA